MRLLLTALLLLLPALCVAQVPPAADTLADWQPPSDVVTYTAGDDTLHVLGDSTWVAVQGDTVTVGCEPLGGMVITVRDFAERARRVATGQELDFQPLHDEYQCIDYMRPIWQTLQ
jgi:hypothetical protein